MKQKGIIIELTSLLDVILIMLFWVMMNSNQQSESYRDKADAEIEAANEQTRLVQAQLEEEKLKEDALAKALTGFADGQLYELKISFDESADVLVLSFGGEEIDRLGFEQAEAIKRAVASIEIPEDSAVLAAVIYDGDKVLYRDMQSIRAALTELSKENDNIYIGYIDTSLRSKNT